MSGFSQACSDKITETQKKIVEIYEESIAQREWKRVRKGAAEVAKLDLFINGAIAAAQAGSAEITDGQMAIWEALNADGSGDFKNAVETALTADGAPTTPGVDNAACKFDWAQLACLLNSLAQAGTVENINAALEIAKYYGRWTYMCSDEVLLDPFYAKANQFTNAAANVTTPGTTPGGTTPGGTTPGGTLPGGNTTTGGAEPAKDAPKDNSKIWLGVGIGAAVLAAGAAAWAFWPKHRNGLQLAAQNPVRRITTPGSIYRVQIMDLEREAAQAGDEKMVEICQTALYGEGQSSHDATRECARVIAAAEAAGADRSPDLPWRRKANKIIAELSRQSYEQANRLPSGQLRKRHVPYSIPELAQELVECLNTHDEERAKELFLSYDGLKATRAYSARGNR